jgi:subtilisin family serine protease
MWLPISGFISDNTYFIRPDPTTTITSPADSLSPIAVTAYYPEFKTLYLEASRGYTSNNIIKPELAAPGVNVIVPTLAQNFITASGTSIAAAHTAGVNAMFLEWGIVRGFYPGIDTIDIKKYLIRGATRSDIIPYPNKEWGYGIIDVYNVFDIFRTGFQKS